MGRIVHPVLLVHDLDAPAYGNLLAEEFSGPLG
jgi:hypothetical protein